MSYTAFVLTEKTRNHLLERFPPKYEKTVAHHVTHEFGNVTEKDIPEDAKIKVVGHSDSGDGLEALVVTVNGSTVRPDGGTYHITWSLNPDKYKPFHSNELLKNSGYKLVSREFIDTVPKFLN